ncbi:MAG: beta-ketoacyl-[acyl-carrier-protein] synthase family protein, partial [Omnitrophica WOR_2 bacterium]
MPERVVITGMGTVSPLGLSVKETWEHALNGVSGVAPITLFDASNFLVKIACEVKGFNPENYLQAKEARRRERFQQFATVAGKEAITQSGLEVREEESYRVGVVIASSIGGLKIIQDAIDTLRDEGPRRISPFAIPMFMPNGAASLIAMDYQFRGPSFTVGSACASSADAIGMAWLMIRSGILDVA